MSPITSKFKDDFQFVLLVSCFVGHPVCILYQAYKIYAYIWFYLKEQQSGPLEIRSTVSLRHDCKQARSGDLV